jgi:hypothetical protein
MEGNFRFMACDTNATFDTAYRKTVLVALNTASTWRRDDRTFIETNRNID